MDEKQIAALREVFEAAYVRHMNSPEIASTWGQRDYTFEEIAAMREGDFYNVGVAGVGQYHGYLNGCWWGFLACYQHLAPQLMDVQRLDWMLEKSAFMVWTKRDGSILQCQAYTQDEDEEYHVLSGEHRYFNTPREAIDAARGQEKKTCLVMP